jgi:hypothetical protein
MPEIYYMPRQAHSLDLTSVTPAEDSEGNLIVCNTRFHTVYFRCFLAYSFPVLRVNDCYVEADI